MSASIPPFASTESVKVETPELTTNPPELILTPVLAVIIPIESILVLSSLVNVPATDTFPVKVAFPTMLRVVPSNVTLLVSSNSPLAPAITIRLSVRSEILALEATKPDPPDTSNPPLASIAPAKVEAPDTLIPSAVVSNFLELL